MHKKEFKAMIDGIDEVLIFRALNLSDESWIQDEYPDYSERNGGDCIDLKMFATILYRVLVNRDIFKAQERTEIDESGEEVTKKVGGVDLFLEQIQGETGKLKVMESFIGVCNMSRPDYEQKELEKVKKKTKMTHLIIGSLSIISLLIITGLILKLSLSH